MISIQYASILILSISLTNAALLNETCTQSTECSVVGSACRDNKCQCNTPFYKPCNASCEPTGQFVYEGGDCEVPQNCIGNTVCQANKCRCNTGHTPRNGVCFKNLGSTCGNDSECGSEYCLQSVCACLTGYTPVDNIICQRDLVDVYNTWDEANRTTSFCTNDYSCADIIAKCYTDPAHPQWKYCKCPDGYTIENANNRRQCKATIGQNLSPLDDGLLSGYIECGQCQDENAVCISATGKRTCWCRAGYENRGNKCESRGKVDILFPNSDDLQKHDYTIGCSRTPNTPDEIKNQLCACAPDYTFDPKDRSCKEIKREWVNTNLEYGLCTHINSDDEAEAEDGVCPEPLKCLGKDDKHVCSCGKDKYRDLVDPTRCVNFIGTGANTTDRICPQNAEIGATGNCVCTAGYAETADHKQCGVTLSPNLVDGSCNASLGAPTICQNFGVKATLCSIGECRCSGGDSFPNNGRCYAPLNTALSGTTENCPSISNLISNICTCAKGFRPTNDLKECVPWSAQLTENRGSPPTTSGSLSTADCQILYTGPVEVYNDDYCQCKVNTFINQDGSGCLYKLNVDLPANQEAVFCPPNTDYALPKCVCTSGFKENGNQCVPITDQLYEYNYTTGTNTSGVNDNACRNLFGWGTGKSRYGDYCACLAIAYLIPDKKVCHFYLNKTTNDFKRDIDCPAYAELYPQAQPSACICKAGYRMTADERYCAKADIKLIGSEIMDSTANCNGYTNDDCTGLYGGEAFCKNTSCYCNRQSSFVNGETCEPLSNYKFPGEHELYLYTCQDDDDCTGKGNVACDYISSSWNYKVCRCQDGSYLNSKTQTCEDNRCTGCNTALNFECRDYVCQCKNGYFQVGNECVKATNELQLYQSCSRSIFRDMSADQSIVCDATCNHAQCNIGYRPEELKCVRPKLSKDQCVHQEIICQGIDSNAFCNRDDNHCSCKPSYYGENDKCARAVGYDCTEDEQCGIGQCKAKKCACKDGQHEEDAQDVFRRPMKRCAKNGIDQIRSNPVLLLLFILACLLFN